MTAKKIDTDLTQESLEEVLLEARDKVLKLLEVLLWEAQDKVLTLLEVISEHS